jgi:hypothetical protein
MSSLQQFLLDGHMYKLLLYKVGEKLLSLAGFREALPTNFDPRHHGIQKS